MQTATLQCAKSTAEGLIWQLAQKARSAAQNARSTQQLCDHVLAINKEALVVLGNVDAQCRDLADQKQAAGKALKESEPERERLVVMKEEERKGWAREREELQQRIRDARSEQA